MCGVGSPSSVSADPMMLTVNPFRRTSASTVGVAIGLIRVATCNLAIMGWPASPRHRIPWYPITDGFDDDLGVNEWHGTIAFICDGDRDHRAYFIVDGLERKGLVVRKSVPGDRRVRAVEITPKGRELFDAAHVAAKPLAERLVAVLEPGEAEQLTDLLTRFNSPAADET
jgi:hypothetical protein